MVTHGDWSHQMLPLSGGTRLRLSRWHPQSKSFSSPLATILILPGRAAQIERYTELAGDLSARGYRVLSMDWRGQGGSSRSLADPMVGHIMDFDGYLDDLDAALVHWQDEIAGPLVGIGHSMGGHILLRHVAERSHPFSGVIACAPMLGIDTDPLPQWFACWLARMAVRLGFATHYAPMQGPRWLQARQPYAGNRLTSDPARFAIMQDVMARDPSVALGGASWGWLDAAFRSIHHYFRHDRLEDVALPVLILSARADRVVYPERHDLAASRLPHCTLVGFAEGRHELLIETDDIRRELLRAIDLYLADLLHRDKVSAKP